MSPTNGDKRTMGNSTIPEIKAKSPQYKKLVTPMSTQSPELRTDTKSKRRRRKGNNWTRKKHAPRSPAQSSGVSPTSSPGIKQEEFKNHEGLEVKSSETLGNTSADWGMDIRRAAVERDFGLRPGRNALGILDRPQLPFKSIEGAEPLPSEESPSPNATEPPRITPRKAVHSIFPTPETPEHDRSSRTSPDNHRKEPTPSPDRNPAKRRRSNESQTSDGSIIIPPHFPPNPVSRPDRAADIFWRNACMEVQHPDGTVHASEVINRLMTRKGGIASRWPRLEEGLEAIERAKTETIDLAEIRRRQEEEDAIARTKEERRLANKRRYRPRGQIDRERAERRAALAVQKAQELENEGANDNVEEDSVDDTEENPAKRAKLDTDI